METAAAVFCSFACCLAGLIVVNSCSLKYISNMSPRSSRHNTRVSIVTCTLALLHFVHTLYLRLLLCLMYNEKKNKEKKKKKRNDSLKC